MRLIHLSLTFVFIWVACLVGTSFATDVEKEFLRIIGVTGETFYKGEKLKLNDKIAKSGTLVTKALSYIKLWDEKRGYILILAPFSKLRFDKSNLNPYYKNKVNIVTLLEGVVRVVIKKSNPLFFLKVRTHQFLGKIPYGDALFISNAGFGESEAVVLKEKIKVLPFERKSENFTTVKARYWYGLGNRFGEDRGSFNAHKLKSKHIKHYSYLNPYTQIKKPKRSQEYYGQWIPHKSMVPSRK